MARVNKKPQPLFTHEGAKAKHITPEQALRRSTMCCLLWEREFYESGEAIADRISELVGKCDPKFVAQLAVGLRNDMKLRHAPLWVANSMLKYTATKNYVADVLHEVIQRPDELCEFLSLYWKKGKTPIAAQVKRGLAKAVTKFNEYQMAKWNRKTEIKLRDVFQLIHPKPLNEEQGAMWGRLMEGTLATPDSRETALSSGRDQKTEWTRLLQENKLGAIALLGSLRHMTDCGVDEGLMRTAIQKMSTDKVLPFRFISAARHAPHLEDVLEQSMFKCLESQPKIPGRTVLLLDHSGSMDQPLSAKSELTRSDAAIGLALLMREVCEEVLIYTFSRQLVRIPPRHGFALRDAIMKSQVMRATFLGTAINAIYSKSAVTLSNKHMMTEVVFPGQGLNPDRLVILTDEQSNDPVPAPQGVGYMINVASNVNGVGYQPWVHIDGWSEAVVAWLREYEAAGFTKETG